MKTKKKRRSFPAVLILLGIGLIAYAWASLGSMRPTLQYLSLAPKPSEIGEGEEKKRSNHDLQKWLDQLDAKAEALSEYVRKLTISASAPDTPFISDEDLQLTGTLHGVGENYFSVYPRALVEGRLFYDEELKWGERACLIDEQVALKLFRTTMPMGRMLTIGGNEYRIIGVLRSESRVGQVSEYNVYVPIRQLAREETELKTVMVSALPIPGVGAATAFASEMSDWAQGETIDIEKENMRALLPVRLVLFLVGFSLVCRCARWWMMWLRRRIDALRKEHRNEYFVRLLPKVLLTALAGVLGFVCLSGACFVLINLIVQPIYTFTEWVPTVPVEWSEIASTYWDVHLSAAKTVSLRSVELLRVRHYGVFVTAGLALMALTGLYFVITSSVIRRFGAKSVRETPTRSGPQAVRSSRDRGYVNRKA